MSDYNNDRFDFIVVGAGSAGSVVAGRLSEAQIGSVCVLEAGPRDRNPFIHIPAGVVYTMFNPRLSWCYSTEPSEATAFRRINQPRGKTLGGSGAINGHIYNRGRKSDYDAWAALGNRGWGYDDVLPFFKRSETRIGTGSDQYHGRAGPFTVTDLEDKEPLCDAFIESAVACGVVHNPDYNGASQGGISYSQRSVHRGRRVSPARAFLYPALKRGNTDVRTDAQVTRILFEGGRAVGVSYQQAGENFTVYANAQVILCGGVFASPQLLQLSGIGPKEHLVDHQIDVQHHLPGVGENLCDHYIGRIMARVNAHSVNERVHGLRLAREVLRYVFTRRGALALTPTLVYGFLKSSPEIEHEDVQITFTPASYHEGVQSKLERLGGVTVACWQQRPKSVGTLRLRSSDPFDAPLIQPNYLSVPHDREILLAAMRWGRRLLRTEPFSQYVTEEIAPGADTMSDEDLLAYASQTGHSAYHPIGTCRMGPQSDVSSVVDDRLRVRGVSHLRVADASIMPQMISGNTNAASLMIGEKAADFVIQEAKVT